MVWSAFEHGRPQKFFQGGSVNILLILVKLLTMQCKCTFTKRFTPYTRLQQSQKKCASLAAISRHVTIIFTIGCLSADFQSRALLFTEVFSCSLTKPQIMTLFSGVQRSGDARGDCLIVCPLPISSTEQWRMVVLVTGYTLFVTSY